jgi:hypothetical protein
MALVIMAAASSEGGNANPVVSRAVTAGAAGPFLIAAMGFAAFLISAGVLTLRSRVFARWTGLVALVGGVSFLITFLTVLDGSTDGSPFGYGFFPGAVALVTWTAATEHCHLPLSGQASARPGTRLAAAPPGGGGTQVAFPPLRPERCPAAQRKHICSPSERAAITIPAPPRLGVAVPDGIGAKSVSAARLARPAVCVRQ